VLDLLALEGRETPAVFVVNSTSDLRADECNPGEVTLRAAIEMANAGWGPDTIEFDGNLLAADTTFLLSGADGYRTLEITDDLEIVVPPDQRITITSEAEQELKYRLVEITNPETTVTFTRVGFTNGWADGSGGAINSVATLSLYDCWFLYNKAVGNGGAIYQTFGNPGQTSILTIEGCLFSYNEADSDGGALQTTGTGTVIVTAGTLFQHNTADKGGACSFFGEAQVSFTGVQVLNNSALAEGGGLYCSGGTGFFSSQGNTAFRENACDDGMCGGRGGAIAFSTWNAEIYNTAFTDNVAVYAGAVFVKNNSVLFDGCGFEGNIAWDTASIIGYINNPTIDIFNSTGIDPIDDVIQLPG
jgi:predicted outer membrane repeat protein